MDLGVFSLTDLSQGATPTARVRDIVEHGVRADAVGLDVFGVGEHHTPRFAVSSPAVVLAAIAARTSSITLTSAVSVLSVLDPVRLYQDFAQLDLVSGGRAEITAGRSAYSEPFDLFGIPISEYDEVFEDKLDLLLALREGGETTWSGRYRTPLESARIIPRLERTLPVRIGAGGTAASAMRAGRLGLPLTLAALSGDPARLRPLVDHYRRAVQEGLPRGGRHREQAAVGVVSHFYVGRTSQQARETFYPHYRFYFADGRGAHLDRATFEQMAAPTGPLVVGSAVEVAEKIHRLDELLDLDRFMGQVDLGGLPPELVRASIDYFAADVAPLLRATSAAPPSRTERAPS